MAIESVPSAVDPKTKNLYKSLGFEDKNGNGVIESSKDENYRSDADINADGKLVKAEILYYLHYVVEGAPENLKQENPVTKEDKAVLASLFKKALKAAKKIKESKKAPISIKARALNDIISKMAKAGLFKEALEAAKTIKDSSWEAYALKNIVSERAKAGLEKEELIELFQLALEAVKTMKGSYYKAEALKNIVSEMVKVGLEKEELSKLFQLALEVARTIKDSDHKAMAFVYIASEMAKEGLEKEMVSKAFKETLEAARTIKNSYGYTSLTIMNIASEMAKAGLEKEMVREAVKEALEATKTIDFEPCAIDFLYPICFFNAKAEVLNKIASEMAKAGFTQEEIDSLFKQAGIEK